MAEKTQPDHNVWVCRNKLLLIKCHGHRSYFNLTRWNKNKIHHVKMQRAAMKVKYAVCFHEESHGAIPLFCGVNN